MVVGSKCQGNTGESQGNLCEWVQSARGMEGMQGNVWEWVYSARGMQGTTRGMQGSGCKVLAE